MQENVLKDKIEKVQKIIKNNEEWLENYYTEQANTILDNKSYIDQFSKMCKDFEHIQFYLTEVSTTLPNIFTITIRYMGQDIANVVITKDKTYLTTEAYNESNKKTFNCNIQLKNQDWNDRETIQFLNYFNKRLTPKGKIDEKAHLESMLLVEFAKSSSETKLFTRYTANKIW